MCAGMDVSLGSKTVQNKNEKIQATRNMFKISAVVAFC
jgi:hypothetical protein